MAALSEAGSVADPASISIIIPTRNGAGTLPAVLSMLRRQSLPYTELLVVDTDSEDTTCDIALTFGATLSAVKKEAFDHGGTRSQIARKAKGEIVVFLTQDAVPVSVDAVAKLVAPLQGENDIAVTYGRQLPNREATAAAAHLRMFNYPAESSVRCFADRERLGLKTIFVSNSFAAYRKSALAAVGYFKNGLIFGEDTCTVGRLLKNGAKIAYVAEAAVYHSHNYTWRQDFQRAFDIGVLHAREKWLIETYGRAEKVGVGYIGSQYAALREAGKTILMIDFIGRNLCKYAGYKFGRNYALLPRFLVPFLSMQRSWWAGRGIASGDR